jgi:flagellar biosynthetic protein FliP
MRKVSQSRPTKQGSGFSAARPAPSRFWRRMAVLMVLLSMAALASGCAPAGATTSIPKLSLGLESTTNPQDATGTLQIVLLLTVLTLAPSILIMTTAFTRIVIVLGFVRNALGVPQMPPNQVMIGLSLILTFYVMSPAWTVIDAEAVQPYNAGQITQDVALERAMAPLRSFMFKQTREKDLALFVSLSNMAAPRNEADIPNHVLLPAFVISELKTAFQMGFLLFIPFLVVDMVVSSALMSLGMMMLPPSVVSLPFKVLLFIMVDGWNLIVRSLVLSFAR